MPTLIHVLFMLTLTPSKNVTPFHDSYTGAATPPVVPRGEGRGTVALEKMITFNQSR
jgi:hypothetical protein